MSIAVDSIEGRVNCLGTWDKVPRSIVPRNHSAFSGEYVCGLVLGADGAEPKAPVTAETSSMLQPSFCLSH